MGGSNSGNHIHDAESMNLPNKTFTNNVNIWYGIFHKGELIAVKASKESAKAMVERMEMTDRLIAPVYVLTTDLATLFLNDAIHTCMEATQEHRKLERQEKELIEEVTKRKGHMPLDYWQPRYKAWLKMEAAKRVVSALEGGLRY